MVGANARRVGEAREAWKIRISESVKRTQAEFSEDKRAEIRAKRSATVKAYWASLTKTDIKKRIAKTQATRSKNPEAIAESYRKTSATRIARNAERRAQDRPRS